MGFAAPLHEASTLEGPQVLLDGRRAASDLETELTDAGHPTVLQRPTADGPEDLQLSLGDGQCAGAV